MNMKMEFTDANFEGEVIGSAIPVVVDFWAPWCGPCKVMSPIVEELAGEIGSEKMKIGAMNVDENGQTAQTYGILSIPTFVVFKGGKEVERFSGSMEKEMLKEKLLKHAA